MASRPRPTRRASSGTSPTRSRSTSFKIPKTWAQLLAITKKYKAKGLVPWSVGAGPSQSQWTLTDWFENIYARTAGPAKYQALFTGKLKFTDPSVANAARIMTQIINNKYVLNGVQGVLGQSFVGGIGDVFGTSAKAQLYFEGGFVGGIATQQVNHEPESRARRSATSRGRRSRHRSTIRSSVLPTSQRRSRTRPRFGSSSSTSRPAPPEGSGSRPER